MTQLVAEFGGDLFETYLGTKEQAVTKFSVDESLLKPENLTMLMNIVANKIYKVILKIMPHLELCAMEFTWEGINIHDSSIRDFRGNLVSVPVHLFDTNGKMYF